jgi:hypothetical protein
MNYAAYYVPPLLVSSYYLLASILLVSLGSLIIIVSFCGCIGGCAVSDVIYKSYLFPTGTASRDLFLHVFSAIIFPQAPDYNIRIILRNSRLE